MYNQTRDEEVVLLKKMWLGEAVICPKCGKAARTGIQVLADGSKVRYCKKCKETFND